MLFKSFQIGLPRRVAAFHLLFSLLALAAVCLGAVVTIRAMNIAQIESGCQGRLSRAATSIALEHHRDTSNLQDIVERLDGGSAIYSAFVGPEGRYLAHSTPSLVGKHHQEPIGRRGTASENIQLVRFINDDGHCVREFRTDVSSGETTLGMLTVAVVEPQLAATFLQAARHAPLPGVAALLIVALGGLVITRALRPLQDIDKQLRAVALAPASNDLPISTVAVRGGGTFGWNRLVDQFRRADGRVDFDARVATAVQDLGQQRNDCILNSLGDGVAVTDEEGRIQFANRVFMTLFALADDAEALAGNHINGCLRLESKGNDAHPLLDASLSSRSVVCEVERPEPDGTLVYRIARQPLRIDSEGKTDEAGNSDGHVWVVRDVTQQRLADNARDQFLSSATHELRTPLTNIKAYAETLLSSESLDVEEQKSFCNTINSEATRLSRFIDELLSVSSLEAGAMAIKRQEVHVERLLREVVEKITPQVERKGITFDVAMPPKLPELMLDKDKFVAALVNVLGNAVKYTSDGGRVTLRVHASDDQLSVVVEDTGVGISEVELPRVFDKFFRSDNPAVQKEAGNGLGLAFSQEVVRLHGGTLEVQSELGTGTAFTITIPAA